MELPPSQDERPFIQACISGDRLKIEEGIAALDQWDRDELLADGIVKALARGQSWAFERLLPLVDPARPNGKGETLLMVAALAGDEAMLARLLPLSNPRAVDDCDQNALHHAAGRCYEGVGHAQCIRILAPLSDLGHADGQGLTPLMLAAGNANLEAVKALIEGSDLEAADQLGNRALDHAREAGAAFALDTVQSVVDFIAGTIRSKASKSALEQSIPVPKAQPARASRGPARI